MPELFVGLATLGPVGKKLPAPGTFGSLVGLCVFGCLVLIAKMSPLLVSLLFIPLFSLEFHYAPKRRKSWENQTRVKSSGTNSPQFLCFPSDPSRNKLSERAEIIRMAFCGISGFPLF